MKWFQWFSDSHFESGLKWLDWIQYGSTSLVPTGYFLSKKSELMSSINRDGVSSSDWHRWALEVYLDMYVALIREENRTVSKCDYHKMVNVVNAQGYRCDIIDSVLERYAAKREGRFFQMLELTVGRS